VSHSEYRSANTIRVTWAAEAGEDVTARLQKAETQIDGWLAIRDA